MIGLFMKNILIVVPARYNSSRLPGKPLKKIAGIEMLKRVSEIAQFVANKHEYCDFIIATDDQRIGDFCDEKNIPWIMTSEACKSGTERCFEVARKVKQKPDFIINLQGDNPLCPPWFIDSLIESWKASSIGEVFTPYVTLSWEELDVLRETKKITPFSGTTVQIQKNGLALTFSKNIIPAIRKEESWRQETNKSPVKRHIGLYGYTFDGLAKYLDMPESEYEKSEGLEQMRFLENAIPVKMVSVDYQGRQGMSGVDSPEDIVRAENILKIDGEFILV